MAKMKELDNLSRDMIRCKEDGFGCHYGQWKALQENPVKLKKDETPDNWKVCPYCGNYFKPSNKGKQIYCDIDCQKRSQRERDREKTRAYKREYMRNKRAERKTENESCA